MVPYVEQQIKLNLRAVINELIDKQKSCVPKKVQHNLRACY